MSLSLISIDAQHAELSGAMTKSTVMSVLSQGQQLLKSAQGQWQLDMAAVTQVSSAGAALLLDWLRTAKASHVEFHIQNLPQAMRPIFAISDLDPLFEDVLC